MCNHRNYEKIKWYDSYLINRNVFKISFYRKVLLSGYFFTKVPSKKF